MSELQMLETTTDATVEQFVAEVTAATAGRAPECFDNRPSWDNWNKR